VHSGTQEALEWEKINKMLLVMEIKLSTVIYLIFSKHLPYVSHTLSYNWAEYEQKSPFYDTEKLDS
jgi:hypothetical protein